MTTHSSSVPGRMAVLAVAATVAILTPWLAQATTTGTLYLRGGSNSDRVEVLHDPRLNPTGGITLEIWVYPTSTTGCQTLIGKYFSDGYWLGLCSGRIRYYTSGSGTSRDGVQQLPINRWSHVAVTFDGTTRRYYVDGVLDYESVTPSELPVNTRDLGIGGEAEGVVYPFSGFLAEARIWDHARSRDSIRRDVVRQIREEEDGLLAVWNLVGSVDDALGRFIATRLAPEMTGPAAPPEPFNPLRIPRIGTLPNINGTCSEYNGLRVPLYYPDGFSGYANGAVRWAWIGATSGAVYLCLDNAIVGLGSPESFAGVYVDPDNSGDVLARTTDYRVTLTQTSGVATAQWGNNSGGYGSSGPGSGWTAVRSGAEFSYSAEFGLFRNGSLLPSGGGVFALQIMQHWLRSVGDDTGFPFDFAWNQPSYWADASVDDSILPPVDSAPPTASVSHRDATDPDGPTTLEVEVQDARDLASATLFVDGVAVAGRIYPGTSDRLDRFEHVASYAPGIHHYWAVAQDSAGRTTQSASGSFRSYAAGASPRLSLSWSPLAPAPGDTVTLRATATDPSLVAAMTLNVDWGSALQSCTISPADSPAVCELLYRTSPHTRSLRFFATARDLEGNLSTSDPRTVVLGNTGADSDGDGLADSLEAALCTSPSHPDSDRDGLEDGWEMFGRRFPDGDVVDLPALGANPCMPDAFVQYDYERGARLERGVVEAVQAAFLGGGVRLHVEQNERPRPPGEALSPLVADTAAYQRADDGSYYFEPKRWWTHYYVYSRHRPGRSGGWYRWLTFDIYWDGWQRGCADDPSQACDTNADCAPFFCMARGVCSNDGTVACVNDRQCTLGDSAGTCQYQRGSCECPIGFSLDEAACRNSFPGTTPCEREASDGQARRLMHELGHAMGLGHGGRVGSDTLVRNPSAGYLHYTGEWDSDNRKPNYHSVMNYTPNGANLCMLPLGPDDTRPSWVSTLDYNRVPLPDLDEGNLDERPTSAFAQALRARSCSHAPPGSKPVALYTCIDDRVDGPGTGTGGRVLMVTDGERTIGRVVQGSSWELFESSPHPRGIDWNCDGFIGSSVSENLNGDGGDFDLPPGDEICGNALDDNGNGDVDEGCGSNVALLRGNADWQVVPSPPGCLNVYLTGSWCTDTYERCSSSAECNSGASCVPSSCYVHPAAYRAAMPTGGIDCRPAGLPDRDCPNQVTIFSKSGDLATPDPAFAEPVDDFELWLAAKGGGSDPRLEPPDHDRPGPLTLDNLEWTTLPGLEVCDGADSDGDGEVDEGCRDGDGDGVVDAIDSCPATANADQADHDGDGLGDACQHPAAVADLAGFASPNGFVLTWSAPAADLLGYTVYRIGTGADLTPRYLGTAYPTVLGTGYTDTSAGEPGRYLVHPVNLNGAEGPPALLEVNPVGGLFADGFESGGTGAWSASVGG